MSVGSRSKRFVLSLELTTKGKLATVKDLSADALGFSHLSFSKQQHSNHCWPNLPLVINSFYKPSTWHECNFARIPLDLNLESLACTKSFVAGGSRMAMVGARF